MVICTTDGGARATTLALSCSSPDAVAATGAPAEVTGPGVDGPEVGADGAAVALHPARASADTASTVGRAGDLVIGSLS